MARDFCRDKSPESIGYYGNRSYEARMRIQYNFGLSHFSDNRVSIGTHRKDTLVGRGESGSKNHRDSAPKPRS